MRVAAKPHCVGTNILEFENEMDTYSFADVPAEVALTLVIMNVRNVDVSEMVRLKIFLIL